MKVSLNIIKTFNKINHTTGDITAIGTEQLIDKINRQLGAIERIERPGDKYNGLLVVKVISCQPHSNADKLKVCQIDDGGVFKKTARDEAGYITIVCGAPNVHEGMNAVWLPPGSVLPETYDKEPLVIEAKEIRGVVSNGMLASPKELALSDSQEGLLDLGTELHPGSDFSEVLNLKDDLVLELENKMFTHRPDCFGFLGIARELAGIQGMGFKSPAWFNPNPVVPEISDQKLELKVINELPELVPRFTAVTMNSVTVADSPAWAQAGLSLSGIRPINNLVDLSNFFMIETGQPLHVYDYDKVKNLSHNEAVITVRPAVKGDELKLLNGKTISPEPGTIMIATDKVAIGLGGIMGGADTEVDEHTKNIIIECANFDMYTLRRTAMRYGLFTDAVTRCTKGQSPLQNPSVILKMAENVHLWAGGQIASHLIDLNHLPKAVIEMSSLHPPVGLSSDFINDRLGLDLSASEIKKILENVEFEVELKDKTLSVKAPFWRTDIAIAEDVVEEVGRLYGYDKLPLSLPERDLTPVIKNELLEAKSEIRKRLVSAGANEVLTYSFVHADLLAKTGQDKSKAYKLSNAISPELQYYRLSLMPSLIEKVHPNIKAGHDQFALFELGKNHALDQPTEENDLPIEYNFTALVVAASSKAQPKGSAYYLALKYLSELCGIELETKPISAGMRAFAVAAPYAEGRSAAVYLKADQTFLGLVGEFTPAITQKLKLPIYCAGFEVDSQVLAKLVLKPPTYRPISEYPKLNQDISLRVPAKLSYSELYDTIGQAIDKNKPANSYYSLSPLDIYRSEPQHKNITFRLTIASYERTLTDASVNQLLDKVAAEAKQKVDARRL